ncbi:uncharacterized protein VTP21DRAFT_2872 [Calcarisporiella thermophila]|uniref:uncharacterized protein n=1 Tax=Calcarisporiella thermophila TaxID=911321 RepID=UPI003742C04B
MSITESFSLGHIETTHDALLIFEACQRGILPKINRRLQEKERALVRSGSVFVFDERESGIKRWTDGRVWSPSRILGNFLIYRELDKRGNRRDSFAATTDRSKQARDCPERSQERALVGSLTNSYRFKRDGLIKKSMSVVVAGRNLHLVSYYSIEDVIVGRLRRPSQVPELADLEISSELLQKHNFREPLMQEGLGASGSGPGSGSGSNASSSPPNSLISGGLVPGPGSVQQHQQQQHPAVSSVYGGLPWEETHSTYANYTAYRPVQSNPDPYSYQRVQSHPHVHPYGAQSLQHYSMPHDTSYVYGSVPVYSTYTGAS